MVARNLQAATVNRRLAAVRSLVKLARIGRTRAHTLFRNFDRAGLWAVSPNTWIGTRSGKLTPRRLSSRPRLIDDQQFGFGHFRKTRRPSVPSPRRRAGVSLF
jgi:hypothetical protein